MFGDLGNIGRCWLDPVGLPLSALLCSLTIHWWQCGGGGGMGNVGDKYKECLNASLVKLHSDFHT